MEDDMLGILKRSVWLVPFAIAFAIAVAATLQGAITIAGAFVHPTTVKPLSSQDLQLNIARSFKERWPTFSTDWEHLPKVASMHD
jgi:hypothetical protein